MNQFQQEKATELTMYKEVGVLINLQVKPSMKILLILSDKKLSSQYLHIDNAFCNP